MRARVLVAIGCLALLWVREGAGQACGPDSITISGSVTDTLTGVPLSPAQVLVSGTTTMLRTDGSGHYTLCAAPLRSVHLQVRLIGYQPVMLRVPPLAKGSQYRVDLRLRPLPGAIHLVYG